MRFVCASRCSRGDGRQDWCCYWFPPRTLHSCADRVARHTHEAPGPFQRVVAFRPCYHRAASAIRKRIMRNEALNKDPAAQSDPRVQLAFERTFLAYERTRIAW